MFTSTSNSLVQSNSKLTERFRISRSERRTSWKPLSGAQLLRLTRFLPLARRALCPQYFTACFIRSKARLLHPHRRRRRRRSLMGRPSDAPSAVSSVRPPEDRRSFCGRSSSGAVSRAGWSQHFILLSPCSPSTQVTPRGLSLPVPWGLPLRCCSLPRS